MKDSADKNTLDAFADSPLGWGGRRPGSGRKATGIVKKSQVVRVPDHLLPAVRAMIARDESVQLQRVSVAEVVEKWRVAAAGKEGQPRWHNVCAFLSELQAALGDDGKL